MATSVLPKHHVRRKNQTRPFGLGRSMSDFVSLMARSWSGVSSKMNEPSNSRCHGTSAGKAWPACDSRTAWICQQFSGNIAHGANGLFLRPVPARAAERVERRTHLAHATYFADEMRLG